MDRILILKIIILSLLLFVILVDIGYKAIPNTLNLLILILAISLKWNDIENFFIGAAIYTLPLVFVYGYLSDLLNKEVFGFGDIKLVMALGLILYSSSVSMFYQVYIFYFFAFVPAAIYSILLYILTPNRKKKFKYKRIAFSPFLIISFFINYFFFDFILEILNRYV